MEERKSLLVIIYTYNEIENIKNLVEEILKLKLGLNILVVDDNSPNGTGKIVEQLSKQYPEVYVLCRQGKRGRGLSAIDGFHYALEQNFTYILEMDADFSHNPEYIPEFLKSIDEYDVVIGSRYTKGGKEQGRIFLRRIISWGANFYIKKMLGINISDCTSGFRCFRKDILKRIDLDNLKSKGPAIITEILFKCRECKIKEIPIVYQKRKGGKSKFNLKTIIESIWQVFKLKANQT